MKIGFLIYSLGGGGAERVVSNLANELKKRGEEVFIYTFDSAGVCAYDLNAGISVRNCFIKEEGGSVSRILKKIFLLRRRLREDSVDVLLAFMISMIPYALFTKPFKTRVIGSERTNPVLHNRKDRLIIRFLSPFCDGFVFQTERAQGFYPKKVREAAIVIGNPVISDIDRKDKKEGIHICAAGRKEIHKDFPTLLKAFAIFNQKYPDSKLTIFGNKELQDSLQEQICELGIQNNILFHGFVKNLVSELTSYTIFLFSSKAEGMPNVLMEAMAAGLPCISTDCEYGPRELIQDNNNGILVRVGDYEGMARAMERLCTDIGLRMRLGVNAEKIKLEYSQKKITEKYLKYIEKIEKFNKE